MTDRPFDPPELVELVELHVVIAGENDRTTAAELAWIIDRLTDLAHSIDLYGVDETCGLIADSHAVAALRVD